MNQDLFDEPLQTLCVGRYLIDVPAQYVLEYQSYPIKTNSPKYSLV